MKNEDRYNLLTQLDRDFVIDKVNYYYLLLQGIHGAIFSGCQLEIILKGLIKSIGKGKQWDRFYPRRRCHTWFASSVIKCPVVV